MSLRLQSLKQRSERLFDSSLAQVVNQRIDEAALAQATASPALSADVPAFASPQSLVPGVQARGFTPVATPFSLATLGLADRFYARLPTGTFTGLPRLAWNGMDDFVHLPDPGAPFSYTTGDGRRIVPGRMYTDGGSIPRLLRGFKKFSSWGFAPAFIVHDWIFTARKCGHVPDHDFDFPTSALVMAEAIKTLMEVGYQNYTGETVKLAKAEDTLYVMYLAVDSAIAKGLWDNPGSVTCLA